MSLVLLFPTVLNAPWISLLSRLFFFNDPATPEIYTLSLHDALPISPRSRNQRAKVLWWNLGRLRLRSIPTTASMSLRCGAKELAQLLRGATAQPRLPTASTLPSQAS